MQGTVYIEHILENRTEKIKPQIAAMRGFSNARHAKKPETKKAQ